MQSARENENISSRLNLRSMKNKRKKKSVNWGKSPVVNSNNLSSHITRGELPSLLFCVKWKLDKRMGIRRWQSIMLINWRLWPTKQLGAREKAKLNAV